MEFVCSECGAGCPKERVPCPDNIPGCAVLHSVVRRCKECGGKPIKATPKPQADSRAEEYAAVMWQMETAHD
jgi:hypothetical protein